VTHTAACFFCDLFLSDLFVEGKNSEMISVNHLSKKKNPQNAKSSCATVDGSEIPFPTTWDV